MADSDTRGRILDVAERLVQVRGFNAFSYGDVADELGMTRAALHYHYAGKAELGHELITRYAARFSQALDAVDASGRDAPAKLRAYAELYFDALRDERMCLCGMLAADVDTLPQPMQDGLLRFFDDNEAWVCAVLVEGVEAGTLRLTATPADMARLLVGALEGAMLVARPYRQPERFRAVASALIDSLAPVAAPATRAGRRRTGQDTRGGRSSAR